MLFTTTGITSYAEGDTQSITAYVTVCQHGEIVTDKNGDFVAVVPIELDGETEYDINDVFTELHDQLFSGGTASGYTAADIGYGSLSITKFWGVETQNVSYMHNGAYAMGLEEKVENNDKLEVSLNYGTYPNTELYATFDKSSDVIFKKDTVSLTLTQMTLDSEYNPVFSPCEGATVTIDGEETEYVTNDEGKAELPFDTAGTYVVSAIKANTVSSEGGTPETTATAITAPAFVVKVLELPETMTHNIAKYYSENGIAEDANMYWLAADFADYSTAYPDSEYVLSATDKQACVDKIIEKSSTSNSQGDLAKCIIALRAMGYDPKNTYTASGDSLDIVAKLNSLITVDSVNAAYYEYTLPYVLIALNEGENYAEEGKLDILLNYAKSDDGKSKWQDTTWGVDGVTPMLLALSHYKDNDGIADLLTEATTLVKNAQATDGSFGNAASTGLAIAGLCAVGENVKTLVKEGSDKTALFALMTYANGTYTMFEPVINTFSTEQGFRGLVALKLAENDKTMYDFKNNPTNEARATLAATPEPTKRPSGGTSRPRPTPTPTATPTVAPSGLPDKNEDVKVNEIINKDKTFEDIKDSKNKNAIEELAARGIIDGIDDDTYEPESGMTRAQFAAIAVRALGLPEKNGFDFEDVSETDWFYSYVNTAYAYGIIDGVSDTEFNPNGKITREEAATMTARAAKLCGMKTDMSEDGIRNILAEFTDYTTVSDWAAESVAFCYSENILDNSVLEINPKEEITRAEMAQMIYNMLEKSKLI